MLLPTSKQFHSAASVEELGEPHRLRIAILMDKAAGPWNPQNSFSISSRTPRAMLRSKAWM
ncbi:hypothetical protein Gogos_022328 [Gossypium gossypioides]|uniref:Uncharacterized protein n=1 Tax=Gossypium gossypioides TaxID=34282 RepID=A0A7J9CZ21_GOSGO|nr:hypothetical protein [Gossypium gossypioides]